MGGTSCLSPKAKIFHGVMNSSTSTIGKRTSPTVFALRTDRYKLINYYGLWDADELYDLENDPDETTNLLYTEGYASIAKDLQTRLYDKMADLGGMEIPLNAPAGNSQNKRLETRHGRNASDFPAPLVVPESLNHNAN